MAGRLCFIDKNGKFPMRLEVGHDKKLTLVQSVLEENEILCSGRRSGKATKS